MRSNAPAPAIAGDVVRLTLLYSGPSGLYDSSLDFMTSVPPGTIGAADMLAFAGVFQASTEADLRAVLSNQVTLVAIQVAAISRSDLATQLQAVAALGTVVQAPLPSEMAVVIRKFSNLKGQHGGGRMSLPGIPVTFTTPATNPDDLNATGIAAFATLTAQLRTPQVSGGITWSPVISTRPLSPSLLVTNAVLISAMSANLVLGTARRRKPGRGR